MSDKIKLSKQSLDEIGNEWIVKCWFRDRTISYKDFDMKEGDRKLCVGINDDFITIFGEPYNERGTFEGNIEEIVIDYNDFNNFTQFSKENICDEISEILQCYFTAAQIKEILNMADCYSLL